MDMAMDLSKNYRPLTHSRAESMDPPKKPEWYHRRPVSCNTGITSYRSRAQSSSFNPGSPVHCRDQESSPESLSGYMNSSLAPGLDLYHNRVPGNLWHAGFYGHDQTSIPGPESTGGEESDSGSDVIFLMSSAKEPHLCSPFIQDGVAHIAEPLSPAVSSLDEGRGCYHLPQPMSSPSPDSSYSEESSDSSVDIPIHHTRPVVLLSDLSAIYRNPAESPANVSSDDSDVIEVSVTNDMKKSCSFSYEQTVKETLAQSERGRPSRKDVRRSSRIKRPARDKQQITCGTSRFSLRRRVRHDVVGIYNESCDSDDMMLEYATRLSSPEADETASPQNESQRASSNSEGSDVEVRTKRNSPRTKLPQQSRRKASHASTEIPPKKPLTIPKSKRLKRTKSNRTQKVPLQRLQKAPLCRNTSKKKVQRRKRKRRTHTGPSALFPPTEPEIQLKYARLYKGIKNNKKCDGFCPFIHVDHRKCTIVNYKEEELTVRSCRGHGQQQTSARSLPGFIPTTSCFQLGRLGLDSRVQDSLSCSLCGQTANNMGLGDLHGPYIPTGVSVDFQNCRTEQKDEDCLLANGHSVDSMTNGCESPSSVAQYRDGDEGSPPKVPPLRVDECWIHEDCGIWSAGIFLVRGKLYGLEEASLLARETVCSACQRTGAIMGCFQKGCSRNYHYTCAIQSGCILSEENFSMRCTEHKNKLLTGGTRRHKR